MGLRALYLFLTQEQIEQLETHPPGLHPTVRELVLTQALQRLEGLLEKALASPDFRAALAENPNTPPTTLEWLSFDTHDHVRMQVARNPASPGKILLRLSTDPVARMGVASNPSAPPDVLGKLAKDPDLDVRRAAAHNPATPSASLYWLVEEEDSLLRCCLATNPAAPSGLLRILARSKHPSIGRALARNPSTPKDILRGLANWDDPVVRQLLSQHPNRPQPRGKVYRSTRGRVPIARVEMACPVCQNLEGAVYRKPKPAA